MSQQKVKCCVIGCGYWGKNLIRNIDSIKSTSLLRAVDTDKKKIEELKRKYPHTVFSSHIEEVLDDPSIEAVVVATPIHSHYNVVKKCLEYDKHVLVEKPLTQSLQKSLELAQLAARKKLILGSDHTFLFSPPVIKIKSIISHGGIGNLYSFNMNRQNLGVYNLHSNVLWDLAPHDLSMLLYWIEEKPSHISTMGRGCLKESVVDIASMNLKFPSGIVANVNLSWLSPNKSRLATIIGSKKMIQYDDTLLENKLKVFDQRATLHQKNSTSNETKVTYRTGDIHSPHLTKEEPLASMLTHFFKSILSKSKLKKVDCQTTLDIVKIIHYANISLKNGGTLKEIKWNEK